MPPIPERSNATIPNTKRGSIFGFKIVLASQRTPKVKPNKKVAEYRKTSSNSFEYLVMPDSLTALPRKKLKNKGAAEGNNKQRTMHAIMSKANFSPDVMLLLRVVLITIPLISFGIKNLTKKGYPPYVKLKYR